MYIVLSVSPLLFPLSGDSRCVLSRNGDATALTQDHKANRDDEVARVQAAGGHVWWDRVMGELAVSRAIGDHCLRPYVIPEPEVRGCRWWVGWDGRERLCRGTGGGIGRWGGWEVVGEVVGVK